MVSHAFITFYHHVNWCWRVFLQTFKLHAGVLFLFLWFGYQNLSATDYVLSRFYFSPFAIRVWNQGFGRLVFITYPHCWRCQMKCAFVHKRVMTCILILTCYEKGAKCCEGWWKSLASHGGGHVVYSWCFRRSVRVNFFFLVRQMSDIWFLYLFIEPLVFWLCSSSTNRLITSKDHASVQLNVGHVDENGVYTGQFTTFALCGFVRAQVLPIVHVSFTSCSQGLAFVF